MNGMNENQVAQALKGLERRIKSRKQSGQATGPKEPQIYGTKMTNRLSKRLQSNLNPKHPTVTKLIEKIKQHRGTTVFYGPNRTGKSSLAASIAWGFDESANFTYSFNFLQQIKETFDNPKRTWSIPAQKLLILDEFEKFNAGEWASVTLDRTICHRHDDMLSNIIITNLSLDELKETLSGSLISRCQETGGIIEISKPWWSS